MSVLVEHHGLGTEPGGLMGNQKRSLLLHVIGCSGITERHEAGT